MIGTSHTTPVTFIDAESAVARGNDDSRFGIGLMIWAIEYRPELLDAALAARPFLLSLSFGSPAPFVDRAHAAGSLVVTQVNGVEAAREAEAAGVDVIVAQGTEAGGHTGSVSTLPLLQAILEAVGLRSWPPAASRPPEAWPPSWRLARRAPGPAPRSSRPGKRPIRRPPASG